MIALIKPIKSLDDLKNRVPENLILVHKDPKKSFTVIGKPEPYTLEKGLKLNFSLLLSFVIDIPSTRFYEGLFEMYSKHVYETYPESFIYKPKEFLDDAVLELYEMQSVN